MVLRKGGMWKYSLTCGLFAKLNFYREEFGGKRMTSGGEKEKERMAVPFGIYASFLLN